MHIEGVEVATFSDADGNTIYQWTHEGRTYHAHPHDHGQGHESPVTVRDEGGTEIGHYPSLARAIQMRMEEM